jgi:hypothetical protein
MAGITNFIPNWQATERLQHGRKLGVFERADNSDV